MKNRILFEQSKTKLISAKATKFIAEKRFAEAVELLSPCTRSKPKDFDILFLMGSALLGLGLYNKSLNFLLAAEDINPTNSRLLNNIASTFNSLSEPDKAIDYYHKALLIDPKFSQAHYNLGNTLMGQNKWNEAIGNYTNAIQYKNDYAEAYGNLSVCLIQIHAFNDAINVCDTYLNQFGLSPKIIANKCRSMFEKGLKANAIQELEKYIVDLPNSSELKTLCADLCMATRQYEKSINYYTESIKINPNEYVNFNNLGVLYTEIGKSELAIDAYVKASEVNRESPIPFQNIAAIYTQLKDYELSLTYLEKARQLNPNSTYLKGMVIHSKIYTCNWYGLDNDIAEFLLELPRNDKLSNPFPPVAYISEQQYLTKIANDWVKNKYPTSSFFPTLSTKLKTPDQKIKLGYFSADLHAHATALLMAGLFEAHDRTKFELIAFSFGPDSDEPLTKRVRSAFDRFIDVRALSDRAVAAYSRELHVDIAIDLKGFTQDSRPGIFAERSAPIQLNYLGFPGSMGASYMDYIVADPYVIPESHEAAYTENVLRMPHCYQPNDNRRTISNEVQTRAEHGLPGDAFVLCSFNNNYKITPVVFDVWMRVLNKFPHAVLWLIKDTATAENNLRNEARARGVDPERLIFAKRLKPEEHLARHVCADLFLDTYPCNAHTTASDALWTGLPLITCSGNSFASRVAGSLLTAIGLQELITTNLIDYEQKIVELMSEPILLFNVKNRLQSNKTTSPLFDTQRYTKDWEQLLLQVHQSSAKT